MRRVRRDATAPAGANSQNSQAVTEYVLLFLGAVLFLAVTASLLKLPLISAVNQISSWTASIQPPVGRNDNGAQGGNRGGGEDNGNNQAITTATVGTAANHVGGNNRTGLVTLEDRKPLLLWV